MAQWFFSVIPSFHQTIPESYTQFICPPWPFWLRVVDASFFFYHISCSLNRNPFSSFFSITLSVTQLATLSQNANVNRNNNSSFFFFYSKKIITYCFIKRGMFAKGKKLTEPSSDSMKGDWIGGSSREMQNNLLTRKQTKKNIGKMRERVKSW